MSLLKLPVATLGTPRIGPRRELKLALESYWAGKSSEAQLLEAAAGLRAANWARQKSLGVTVIPSGDESGLTPLPRDAQHWAPGNPPKLPSPRQPNRST